MVKRVMLTGLLAGVSFGQSASRPLDVPLIGTNGQKIGMATFRMTMRGRLNVSLEVEGLALGEHGVHLHENPVCDGAVDFRSAGGHFNPDGRQHGLKNLMGHHAGDLPENLKVLEDPVRVGNARTVGVTNFSVDGLSMKKGDAHSIVGRSIVVHERPDDGRTDPSGDAGNRLACGVIVLP